MQSPDLQLGTVPHSLDQGPQPVTPQLEGLEQQSILPPPPKKQMQSLELQLGTVLHSLNQQPRPVTLHLEAWHGGYSNAPPAPPSAVAVPAARHSLAQLGPRAPACQSAV
jgi:hypothetical protein